MPKRVDAEPADVEEMLSPKKRKRIQSSSSAAVGKVSLVSPAHSQKVIDPYQSVIAFEEQEATTRSSEQDMKLFHDTCTAIRKLLGQIDILKKYPDQNSGKIAELRTLAGLHVLSLKKINRLEKLRLRAARDLTHAAKQRVDTLHLTLQNLSYEIVHVRREVNRCLEFKSQDEAISLVSEDDFYRDAPEDISQPSVTRSDEHRRHLARLSWELEQRRRLSDTCRELETQQQTIGRTIGAQRLKLTELAPQLNAVLESTKPLQEALGLPLDKQRQQHRLATLLPRPLYVLYVQTSAYAEACDPELSSLVTGSEEEALSLRNADQRDAGAESDSDQEAEEEEGRKKRHRKKTGRQQQESQRMKQLLRTHPLRVKLTVNTKDAGRLVLEFSHLTELDTITVSVSVEDCPARGSLVNPDSVLQHLYPGDVGLHAPSAAVQYRLQRAGLPPFEQLVTSGSTPIGRPYLWAQRLAGLEVTERTQETAVARSEYSALHVEDIVSHMRARLSARVTLQAQLTALAGGDVSVPPPLQTRFPSHRDARLLSWASISVETYRSSQVLTAELVDDADTCFMAKLGRSPGSPQLHVYVALSPRHPTVAPLCGVLLSQLGQQPVTAASPRLRCVEYQLNVRVPEEQVPASARAALLPAQLLTALDALDILMETDDGLSNAGQTQQRPLLRKHRGRDRVPPLHYLSSMEIFTHTT